MLADNSEFPQKGRVENTVNQVDPKTGTLELQARFPNPQHTLLPGPVRQGSLRERTCGRTSFWFRNARFSSCRACKTVFTVGPDNKVKRAPDHDRGARGRRLDRHSRA